MHSHSAVFLPPNLLACAVRTLPDGCEHLIVVERSRHGSLQYRELNNVGYLIVVLNRIFAVD